MYPGTCFLTKFIENIKIEGEYHFAAGDLKKECDQKILNFKTRFLRKLSCGWYKHDF